MAREIAILRKLDHPNIMKLEGIIASPLSTKIYLVFEYMEHDLSGLISNPDIKFSNAQIKCYMWQLLCGLEHCHSHGLIHRDIKTSNILVNNEGVLKIADFGIANFVTPKNEQQLTNRVVTLWYRPPEIFMGSTSYKETVDLWSVGCVFAEMFAGRPLLKGRNEVEQLHKIFKFCGTPSDEYWQISKLPLATMFKPQHPADKVARDDDLLQQIGKDIHFDLVDHEKVRHFRIQKQIPFMKFKEEVAREFGVPVQLQRYWIWAKRQNHTYRPNKCLTPREEAHMVSS